MGEIDKFVGSARGYVIAGDKNANYGSTAWFSPDGSRWREATLFETVPGCSGTPTEDSYSFTAAAGESGFLVVGRYFSYTPDTCGPDDQPGGGLIAWTSTDGVSWRRSEVFAGPNAVATAAWAVPGGWEIAVTDWSTFDSVWRTTDGAAWQKVLDIPGTEQGGGYLVGSAAADGTRLVASGPLLLRSVDGLTWDQLGPPPGADGFSTVVAPSDSSPSWLLAGNVDGDGPAQFFVSADLNSWQMGTLPGERSVTAIAASSVGYVASGEFLCSVVYLYGMGRADDLCPAPRQRQYLSLDGIDWRPIDPRLEGEVMMADGPSGVLLLGVYSGRIWQLRP